MRAMNEELFVYGRKLAQMLDFRRALLWAAKKESSRVTSRRRSRVAHQYINFLVRSGGAKTKLLF